MDSHSRPGPTEYVVEPYRPWRTIRWTELVDHRDLLLLLVRRDLLSRYRQTALGPAWYVVQPLLMSVVFSVVFGRIAHVSTDGAPRILFYLCSQLGWNYFVHNLNSIAGTFTSNASIFGKVYFPRLIVPLAALTSNLVALALQLAVFLAFLAAYRLWGDWKGHGIGWSILCLPALIAHVAALSLGVGLCISALTAKYRDLMHALSFVTLVWMFLTPVFYPLSEIPQSHRWLALANPMAAVVEAFRFILLGIGSIEPLAIASSAVIAAAILFAGILVFQRAERTVMDVI